MKTNFVLFTSLIIGLSSCSWHSMYLEPVSQPIYFGTPIDSSMLDCLGSVSGACIHQKEEETVSQSENVSVSFGGEEYTKENINSAIRSVLQGDHDRFITGGRFVIEIEQGISVGAFFSSCIATIITQEGASPGTYIEESIYFRGTVCKLKIQENQK